MTFPRSTRQALADYAHRFQATASCVSRRHVLRKPGGAGTLLRLEDDISAPNGGRLVLLSEEQIDVGVAADLRVVAYRHQVMQRDGREIIAFHLHRGNHGPHLHLGAGAGELFDPLYKAHIPTGPVDFGDVIAMLIRDFGVQPRRTDWERVLAGGTTAG